MVVDLTSVSDGHLLAFLKAMVQARFSMLHEAEMWASPFVADFHCDVVEEYKSRCRSDSHGKLIPYCSEDAWHDWLLWQRNNPAHAKVIEYLHGSSVLRSMVQRDPDVMREWLRPWILDDDVIVEFAEIAAQDEVGTSA